MTGWEWMCECPSHQESAWGAAEARQERVIVEVVRKASAASILLLLYLLNTSTNVLSVLS